MHKAHVQGIVAPISSSWMDSLSAGTTRSYLVPLTWKTLGCASALAYHSYAALRIAISPLDLMLLRK